MEREKTVRLFMAGSGGGNGRTRARAHDATPKGPPIFPAQTSFGHPSGGEGDTHSNETHTSHSGLRRAGLERRLGGLSPVDVD